MKQWARLTNKRNDQLVQIFAGKFDRDSASTSKACVVYAPHHFGFLFSIYGSNSQPLLSDGSYAVGVLLRGKFADQRSHFRIPGQFCRNEHSVYVCLGRRRAQWGTYTDSIILYGLCVRSSSLQVSESLLQEREPCHAATGECSPPQAPAQYGAVSHCCSWQRGRLVVLPFAALVPVPTQCPVSADPTF